MSPPLLEAGWRLVGIGIIPAQLSLRESGEKQNAVATHIPVPRDIVLSVTPYTISYVNIRMDAISGLLLRVDDQNMSTQTDNVYTIIEQRRG